LPEPVTHFSQTNPRHIQPDSTEAQFDKENFHSPTRKYKKNTENPLLVSYIKDRFFVHNKNLNNIVANF